MRQFLAKYDSYSDFNFTSIYTWGNNKAKYAWLDSNLIISLPDYLTNATIISIIGSNNVNSAVDEVIKYAKKQGVDKLSLVPEIIVTDLDKSKFDIIEDRDNYDYIYSVNSILNLRGNEFEHKRYHIRKTIDRDAESIKVKVFKKPTPLQKKYMLDIFNAWAESQPKNKYETENERKAIEKILKFSKSLNIEGLLLFYNNEPVAFEIHEITKDGEAIGHFMKSKSENSGIFSLCTYSTVMLLEERGCKQLNIEQDFGIPGLRHAKESYHPVKFLKKYTVTLKID